MATNPNDIELTDEDRRLLADVSDRSGKPWRTVLRETLGLITTPIGSSARKETSPLTQREAALKLIEEIKQISGLDTPSDLLDEDQQQAVRTALAEFESMPMEGQAGEFCNRDHDAILYGDK